jgi:hypothetical protein
MFGRRQGRQVNIQPQPVVREAMLEGPALAAKEGLAALPQLGQLRVGKPVQCARHGRLIGKAGAPPCSRQREIGAQAGIDLADGPAARQDADQHIEQLVGRLVLDRFERQSHVRHDRHKKVRARQTVAEYPQWSTVGFFRHRDQANDGAHDLPPHWTRVLCGIVPHLAEEDTDICYPHNFAQN